MPVDVFGLGKMRLLIGLKNKIKKIEILLKSLFNLLFFDKKPLFGGFSAGYPINCLKK